MDLVFIVKSLVGLIFLLGVLIAILLYSPFKKKKKAKKVQKEKQESDYTFEELVEIIKKRNTSADRLQWALRTIIKYHGQIAPKDRGRLSDEFYKYSEIIVRICKHPNTTKSIIIEFDRALEKLNPQYQKEINDFLTKGLNSRTA